MSYLQKKQRIIYKFQFIRSYKNLSTLFRPSLTHILKDKEIRVHGKRL